ncbi:hypothetical protein C0V75_07335 [Tabrizicola sp. TH137]|uniref:capsular polysaccharide synthesis protein n=1 Tax=Tabrizicola sp. TH137 TaxID=2067452 RepID=UPI000C799B13|nr:capsular polysaccharide synthesis protein [Tabrizicola sp. TH137]PLL13212.1 hypothetical protein C0V75_07335 [Tabrizicola sp. TH137]
MKIWTLWLQGRKAAPEFVQKVFLLWEALNPGCKVTVLEKADADRILGTIGLRKDHLSPQVQANFVRTWLLANEGGVWVDSTLLPTRSLESWLPDLLDPAGFFAFSSSGDPNLVLQNWFLAARPENTLIQAWLANYADYFQSERRWPSWKRALYHGRPVDFIRHRLAVRRRDMTWFVDPARGRNCLFYPYAAHNYCLAQVLASRTDVRAIWNRVPFRTADLPLALGRSSQDPETPEDTFFKTVPEYLPLSPVHKLNHRDGRFSRIASMVAEINGISVG